MECCKKKDLSDEDIEIVKILVPLTDDPNASDKHGRTPIHWAAKYGCTEIVKILASLTENPNSPAINGMTPIHWAADRGHIDVVKILTSLTNNPNPSDVIGDTPIFRAVYMERTETVKFLAPLTYNPDGWIFLLSERRRCRNDPEFFKVLLLKKIKFHPAPPQKWYK